MLDELEQPIESKADSKPEREFSQYQPQTVSLHDTIGVIVLGIVAITMLFALLRQQRYYRDLALRLTQHQ